jgi:hypothetical protein
LTFRSLIKVTESPSCSVLPLLSLVSSVISNPS